MSVRNIARAIPLLAAAVILLLPLAVQAAPPSGGGGSKVTVTAANPPDAFQGEELDVIVSGTGFDAGSQVSYLVTGTTDASQVDVLSVQFISSTELKTRIRPKDAALPTEYDIQVQTSSGRKGKGTTLFSVKLAETACTGDEPKEPEIVYLSAVDSSGEIDTQDIYLSSASGCDQYLLVEDAGQIGSTGTGSDPKVGQTLIAGVLGLRLDFEGSKGIVVWRDNAHTPSPLLGIRFAQNQYGSIVADTPGPELLYLPPDDYSAYYADVRINDLGEAEVVVVERDIISGDGRLVYFNADTGHRAQLIEGGCTIRDAAGTCLIVGGITRPWWNEDGSLVYFNPYTVPEATDSVIAMARIERNATGWQPPQVLMTNNDSIQVLGIRPDGLLAYEWFLHTVSRNGRRTDYKNTYFIVATIDPELCTTFECSTLDGQEMAADPDAFPRGWTRDGGMLFIDYLSSQVHIRAYSDPQSGAIGALDIADTDRYERDTSY
jgi:hypothetical protein